MKGYWIVLAVVTGSVVLQGGGGCAAISAPGEPAEAQAVPSSGSITQYSLKSDMPQPEWEGQADRERFKGAHLLVRKKKFAKALELLKKNIDETPNAGDIDYSYAWTCVCLTELDRFDEALRYYEIICTRYYGSICKGAGGAIRNWSDLLDEVKNVVRESSFTEKARILEQMAKLDKTALDSYLADAEKLIRSASNGDKEAAARLRGADYRRYEEALIKLIEIGRLKLTEQK